MKMKDLISSIPNYFREPGPPQSAAQTGDAHIVRLRAVVELKTSPVAGRKHAKVGMCMVRNRDSVDRTVLAGLLT